MNTILVININIMPVNIKVICVSTSILMTHCWNFSRTVNVWNYIAHPDLEPRYSIGEEDKRDTGSRNNVELRNIFKYGWSESRVDWTASLSCIGHKRTGRIRRIARTWWWYFWKAAWKISEWHSRRKRNFCTLLQDRERRRGRRRSRMWLVNFSIKINKNCNSQTVLSKYFRILSDIGLTEF